MGRKRRDEHSVFSEPHLAIPAPPPPDSAANGLRRDAPTPAPSATAPAALGPPASSADAPPTVPPPRGLHHAASEPHLRPAPAGADAPLHSVFDEPDILPAYAESQAIEQDWSCSECGYNLRGTLVGRPCPECGHIEPYRPPPVGASSYASWLIAARARSSVAASRTAVTVVALVGGLLGVVGTFLTPPALGALAGGSLLYMVAIAPTIEELMKLGAAAWLVELRPYLVRTASQLRGAAFFAGLGFAVLENILYLNVYVPNPTIALMLWRWLLCTTLHISCCLIAANGLVRVWERTITEGRPPRMDLAIPAFVTAMGVHGAFNLTAAALSFAGFL